MRKLLPFYTILFASFLMFSCVDPDPAAVYGWNSTTGPTSNITGPRILEKVDSLDAKTYERYISTSNGILESVEYYSDPTPTPGSNQVDKFQVYYNSVGKIDSVLAGNNSNSSFWNVYLDYDSSGRVVSGEVKIFAGSIFENLQLYNLTYNNNNQIVKIEGKTKFAMTGDWEMYSVSNLTYTGDNLATADYNSASVNNGIYEPLDPSSKMEVILGNYDDKHNPYSTIVKEFFIAQSLLLGGNGVNLQKMSPNNSSAFTQKMGGNTMFSVSAPAGSGMIYDSQNFLIGLSGSPVNYKYKAIN